MPSDRPPSVVYRIPLGNDEFEGRNNAYLLVGEGPTTLVDTGVATAAVRRQLEAGLAEHGTSIEDVDSVVLTHWHYDHSGLASHVRSTAGATVYAHEADAPIVRDCALAELLALYEERLDAWGIPTARQAEIRAVAERSARLAGDAVDVVPLTEGDEVPAGDETLRVLHTPGHTAGLVSLLVVGAGAAFVGDAVLPVYTPNVGGADLRVGRPLATYRESLATLAEADVDRLYPGHRDVIGDPGGRIQEILDHHEERTRRVVEAIAERGPSTAWEVSAALFGDLEGIHVLHGPGEAFAHLDDLEARGRVERTGRTYRLADADRPAPE